MYVGNSIIIIHLILYSLILTSHVCALNLRVLISILSYHRKTEVYIRENVCSLMCNTYTLGVDTLNVAIMITIHACATLLSYSLGMPVVRWCTQHKQLNFIPLDMTFIPTSFIPEHVYNFHNFCST